MELAPGVVNPLFLCELALELRMPVGELETRMSAHELTVVWPAFFAYRAEAQDRDRERDEMRGQRTMGRG